MTSQIDATKPTEGQAYTNDVRTNFAIARDEISNLQDEVTQLQSDFATINPTTATEISTLQQEVAALAAQVAALQTQVATNLSGGTWIWQSGPQTFEVPPQKPQIGVDTSDPSQATTLAITPLSNDGTDFTGALQMLENGDRLLLWARTASTNQMRFTVTAPGAMSGNYFRIPVAVGSIAGAEPGTGDDVNVEFIFA